MNWKLAMLEIAELGLLSLALWIPFRMGRAGIKNLWSMLAGWFALAAVMMTLVSLSTLGINGVDHDLVNSMPEGPHALLTILLGWIPASIAAAIGQSRKSK